MGKKNLKYSHALFIWAQPDNLVEIRLMVRELERGRGWGGGLGRMDGG